MEVFIVMKVILTESQYKHIILENSKKSLIDYLGGLKEFSKTVIDKTQSDINIHLKMLLIWGAGVGGVIGPLNEFIENGNFNLSESDVALILCATAAILFDESKSNIKKLLQEISERGLVETFSEILRKGTRLKNTFIKFIGSLNMTLSNVTNIMSYAFLIPILPILLEIANSGFNQDVIKEIAMRLISFGLASLSSNLVRELITKLLNRFRD